MLYSGHEQSRPASLTLHRPQEIDAGRQ